MSARFNLNGQVALVTGGSRGIGRAIALGFAEAGASVAIVGRDPVALKKTRGELAAKGVGAAEFVADVSKVPEIRSVVDAATAALGPIDVLVTSAGISEIEPSAYATEENWDKILATNLKGSFFTASYVARGMIERHSGRIIFIASEEGIVGVAGHAAYGASKAGIIHLTKVLALEWGEHGIRVNCIAPAASKTKINETYWLGDPVAYDWVVSRIALGRVSEADEMAGAAVFLASDASSFVTGHTLVVDGGISVGLPRRKHPAS
jgi:NAD(P)-dependent dehydrogenase (short-subunit alcohol dehydrogenase family)